MQPTKAFRGVWLVLIVAAACRGAAPAAPPDKPVPPVSGPAVASRVAVSGLKVVNANWPDPSSMRQFGDDAARLEGARTAEERAVAIWRWIRRVTMATTGQVPYAAGRSYVYEPITVLNVYGSHYCDGLSRMMASAWQAQGLPAQKLYRSGHTMAECWWRDADGVGRYHMFDVNYGYFLHSRDGGHIASAEEIGLDFSLAAFPSRNARPWIEKQWWMWSWTWPGWPPDQPYDGAINLRAGESSERLWGNVGRPYCDNMFHVGPDPDDAAYPMSYGNGVFRWSEDFTDAARFAGRAVLPPANAKLADGQLGQAEPGSPAEVVYRGRFRYVVSDIDLDVEVGRGGSLAVETSVDGGLKWREAWRLACRDGEKRRLTLSKVQPIFDGTRDRRRRGGPVPSTVTPRGRYDYLLRLRLDGGLTLRRIACDTVVQLNYLVLPNLAPGDNPITISGRLADGAAVEVVYEFDDAEGKDRRHVAVAESLPFSYTIRAAGRTWRDVRCRRLTVREVAADGKGNRVVSAPPPPKTLPAGPVAQLDVRGLNAITPQMAARFEHDPPYVPTELAAAWARNREPFPPRLRPAADCVADLASPDEDARRYAAAALAALRAPAAWAPLEKLAIEDTSRAKYYAVQALYWTDAARAWPVMARILRGDAGVRFADGRGRTEAPTRLNVSAMIAALAGRSRIRAAVPLICKAIDDPDGWYEARWAMIRALGRIGDPAAIPTVRKFLNATSDTQTIAIEALTRLGDRESLPAILKSLDRPNMSLTAEAALGAVIAFKPADCTERVVPLLANWRAERRALAAEALAACGDPAVALPALRAALEVEAFAYAREQMADAIRRLESQSPAAAVEASATGE